MRDRVRTHGKPPFRVVVLHGGPGAPGSARALARELGTRRGVLEPFQGADSVDGQVEELRAVVEAQAEPPVVAVGWSWGAMLAYLFAAHHPELVGKLILIASAVFDDDSAGRILDNRLERLDPPERDELLAVRAAVHADPSGSADALDRLARLVAKADAYDPLTLEPEHVEVQPVVNQRVGAETNALRASGELLALGERIRVPVVAIHGDHDPHPAAGVRDPLRSVLTDFRFIELDRCGHTPWQERQARGRFYALLEDELR